MKKINFSSFLRSLKYLKKYIPFIILTFVLSVVYVGCSLVIPIIIGDAIDAAIYSGEAFEKGLRSLIFAVILAFTGGVCNWSIGIINNKVTYDVVKDMRKDAFQKIHSLPMSYLDGHTAGDIVSRIISDVEIFSDGMLMGLTQLFTGVLTILATLVFMLILNPIIAIVVVTLTPLSMFVASFISKRTHKYFTEQAKIRGRQTGYINEMIENIKTVKAFSNEEKAERSFCDINSKLEKSSLNATFYSSLVNPTTRFVNAVVYAAVAGAGAFFATGNSMLGAAVTITVGELSVFLSYVNQYTKPFNEISGVIAELQNALSCAERFFDFIQQENEIPDGKCNAEISSVKGNISLNNVSFSYTQNTRLLNNINIDVKTGQKIAIVGPTGCGKTTLINLLMRFYDVDSGSIMIDGKDIRNITRKSLRSCFGMVLQETWLKHASVKDNLKLGKPDASDDEMIEACKRVHCHGFISRMENGYDTVINENGGELSEGQKQLICIARAMISNPPILILDEATSSIDTRTEARVQKAMKELMEGRTSFIVAHRLSTVKEADMILVMNDGNIAEKGTHNELLMNGGLYYEIFNSQFN